MEERRNESEIKREIPEYSDIVDLMGRWGYLQKKLVMFLFFFGFPNCWNNLGLTFMAPKINYWCSSNLNMSEEDWKKYMLPKEERDGKLTYSQCRMYDIHLNTTNSSDEIECHRWHYDLDFYHSTIIEKWDLVCDKAWLTSLSQTLYFSGFLVSMFICGQLSDRFGRKRISLLCVIGAGISGVICMLSPTYTLFAASRFFIAFFRSGSYICMYVLVMECVGKEYRSHVGLIQKYGWATAYIILPAIVWLVRDWFYIQLIATLPFFLLLSIYWLVPESPRWLLSQNRLEEAETILKRCLKENNIKVENLREIVLFLSEKIKNEMGDKKKRQANILDLFKTPNLRKKTLILCYAWFSSAFGYYGLSLNANEIGGHPLLYFFFSGLVEFPAATLGMLLIKYIGRRRPQVGFLISSGIICILAAVVPSNLLELRIFFAVMAKLCVSASFLIIYIFSSEIYPTVIRNVGMGTSSMCARIGTLVVPFLKELGEIVHQALPLTLLGTFSITSGLLVLLLPETLHTHLPDTLAEGEQFGR
ncbi:organic cation transporter protein-like [Centruroides sculpturatus]|uniref:organic cation transporter protein-like n=1 Tax=Centruroides sculpturatus TaxID=218467 RepID=UPI000C6DC254|nr:organic cation transporter protein-like [Centruroides sculpturatus]